MLLALVRVVLVVGCSHGTVGSYTFEFNSLLEVGEKGLSDCDIWFSGGSTALNITEIAHLRAWTFEPGNFLIGGCDATDRDGVCRVVQREVLDYQVTERHRCQKPYAKMNSDARVQTHPTS
jgi:hypothetical protein